MKERVREAMGVMGQMWGIGKRRFGGNWGRRIKLLNWLIGSVVGFGAEICGWRKWVKVERLQEKYILIINIINIIWVLGVDGRTPRCMMREEGKRKKMRMRLGKRALEYEEKLEKRGASDWARK